MPEARLELEGHFLEYREPDPVWDFKAKIQMELVGKRSIIWAMGGFGKVISQYFMRWKKVYDKPPILTDQLTF